MSVARFEAMGCEVVVGGAEQHELLEIQSLFTRRETTFTRFRPSSELNRVNASGEKAVVVSEDFALVLRRALDAAAATAGLVEPTVADALLAAGYDRDIAELEDDPRPATHAGAGRWRSVRVLGRLAVRPPGVGLDLNGVVKGLTVDEALALLAGPGFVSAGGDLAVHGPHIVALPGGDAVTVRSGGLATSGTTRRAWSRGGRAQHHLIDPPTGRPSASRWREVTVSAADCLTADVAAKAAFLLDGAGPSWLDGRMLPGRFVSRHGAVLVNESWRRAVVQAGREEMSCT